MKYSKYMLAGLIALSSLPSMAEFAVIAHPSMTDSLDTKMISKLYLGKSKKLPNGLTVQPIDLDDGHALRAEFLGKILKKEPSQLKSYWTKRIFTGKGKPPQSVADSAAVIEIIKNNEGAIGYIKPELVTSEVKVIGTY